MNPELKRSKLITAGASASVTLVITIVLYIAWARKKVKDWPWYGKFFTFMAIWGVGNTIAVVSVPKLREIPA